MTLFEAKIFAKKFGFGASGIAMDGLYNSHSISLICSLKERRERDRSSVRWDLLDVRSQREFLNFSGWTHEWSVSTVRKCKCRRDQRPRSTVRWTDPWEETSSLTEVNRRWFRDSPRTIDVNSADWTLGYDFPIENTSNKQNLKEGGKGHMATSVEGELTCDLNNGGA